MPQYVEPQPKPRYNPTFSAHPLEKSNTLSLAEKLKSGKRPKTVEEAIERLTKELSLKDKATIANMAESELSTLHSNLGKYIRNEFDLWSDNKALIASCIKISGDDSVDQDSASSIIIRELWKRLRTTHRLRVVK
jgi:hypothetical protein